MPIPSSLSTCYRCKYRCCCAVWVTILLQLAVLHYCLMVDGLAPTHVLRHRALITASSFKQTAWRQPNKLSSSSLVSSLQKHENDPDFLLETIQTLRQDRERRKLELLATEMALLQAERELQSMTTSKGINSSISSSSSSQISGNVSVDRPSLGYDYGFESKSMGPEVSTKDSKSRGVPSNAIILGGKNFQLELQSFVLFLQGIFTSGNNKQDSMDPVLQKLSSLKLSNAAIWERESIRPPIKAPWIIKAPYLFLCLLLDILFEKNPIERFYFLETVARMPYFSYITMLHTYETLGWWRRSSETKRVHFAEELNELNHLLIMISLGGDQNWRVRFLAQHAAIAYYFVLIGLWLSSPTLAYNFSELIEAHAVDTYAEFAESNKDVLVTLRAPICAKEYYESADMYIFDEFQTARQKGSRRPVVNNLYDVFCNIRDDEAEHVNTMASCQDPDVLVRSPNTESALVLTAVAAGIVAVLSSSEGVAVKVESIDGVMESITSALGAIGAGISSTASDPNRLIDLSDPNTSTEVMDAVEKAASSAERSGGQVAVTEILKLIEKHLKF